MVTALPAFLAWISTATCDINASACARVNRMLSASEMQNPGSLITFCSPNLISCMLLGSLCWPRAAPMNMGAVGTAAERRVNNACGPLHAAVSEGGPMAALALLLGVIAMTWMTLPMLAAAKAENSCETRPEEVVAPSGWMIPPLLATAFWTPRSEALPPSRPLPLCGMSLLAAIGSATRASLALNSQRKGLFLVLLWQARHCLC